MAETTMPRSLGGEVRGTLYARGCPVCGTPLEVGPRGHSDREVSYCPAHTPSSDVAQGHRHGAVEQMFQSSHLRSGPLLLDRSSRLDVPGLWPSRAIGQEVVCRCLDACASRGVIVLHNRFAPGHSGVIAEMAIGPSGIYVIDIKQYEPGAAERGEASRLKRRTPRFFVSDGERTELVLNMAWRMDVVRRALRGLPEAQGAPGQPIIAVIDAKWALMHSTVEIDGILLARPEKIAKIVSQPGKLSRSAVERIAERLDAQLPPA